MRCSTDTPITDDLFTLQQRQVSLSSDIVVHNVQRVVKSSLHGVVRLNCQKVYTDYKAAIGCVV